MEKIERVGETQAAELTMDADLEAGDQRASVNLTVLPLVSDSQDKLGTMIMIEDISTEKRVKSTMARYMDPGLADQVLEDGREILGGKSTPATVLFSDIRGFTSFSEKHSPEELVAVLNQYMKTAADAVLAAFGLAGGSGSVEDI